MSRATWDTLRISGRTLFTIFTLVAVVYYFGFNVRNGAFEFIMWVDTGCFFTWMISAIVLFFRKSSK